jgi:hypothetical protein
VTDAELDELSERSVEAGVPARSQERSGNIGIGDTDRSSVGWRPNWIQGSAIGVFSCSRPTGHGVDISNEKWTQSLRIYSGFQLLLLCRFSNPVSYRGALTFANPSCPTSCHLGSVSNSCHFFRTTRLARARATPAVHVGASTLCS